MRPGSQSSVPAFLLWTLTNAAAAATLVVDPGGSGDFTAIQPALDAAADGDTVLVRPGEYLISLRLDFNRLRDTGQPGDRVTKNLTLRSEAGPQQTVLRWTGGDSIALHPYPWGVIAFRNDESNASVVEGFTITGATRFAAVTAGNASPVIRRCILAGNGYGVEDGFAIRLEQCLSTGNGWGASFEGGRPTIARCTIAGNLSGVAMNSGGTITGSILWDNGTGNLLNPFALTVSFSDLEEAATLPGNGNIRADPRFCGWPSAEVHVDAAAPPGGDGTAGRPHRNLAAALDPLAYSHALGPGSPCLGAAEGGANMGADLGTCVTVPIPWRTLRVRAGSYDMAGLSLTRAARLEGAGVGTTILRGTVYGLRTGSVLSDVTVTGGQDGGVVVSVRQGPAIERCRITGNLGGGLWCFGPATVSDCLIDRNQGEEWGGGVRTDAAALFRRCTIVENAAGSGGGVFVGNGDPPVFEHCTIAGNAGGGAQIHSAPGKPATFRSCIVWGNGGAAMLDLGAAPPVVSFSAIEGSVVWPGPGNLNADPLLCGSAGNPIVHVDAAAAGPGDGSAASPYRDIAKVLEFGYGLAAASPCRGTGDGGTDMGAPVTGCQTAGRSERLIVLGPGEYDLAFRPLAHGVSLVGAGEEKTIVRGTVEGLRSKAFLGFLSVTAGTEGGVRIVQDSPRVLHVTLRESSGRGLSCSGAAPSIEGATIRANRGGVYCNDSSAVFTNCVILANGRPEYAAIVVDGTQSPVFLNCTITGNSGLPHGPGGINCLPDASPVFTSCIVWENPFDTSFEGHCSSGSLTSCLDGVDPLFVDPGVFDFTRFRLVEIGGGLVQIPDFIIEEPDLRLQPVSPAVDAGSAQGAPATDLLGNLRPCGQGPDIGAYEVAGCSGDAVVDDGGPDDWSTGEWRVSGGANPHGGASLYARDPGAAFAFFIPLAAAGTHRVSLWWTHWPSRLPDVPVEVLHDGGSSIVLVDQRANGGQWNMLGEWSFSGGRAVVIVRSPGGGTVCADAVRVSLSGSAQALVLDNGEPGTTASGYWALSGGKQPYGATSLYSREPGARYTFAFAIPAPGSYDVSLWWTPYPSRSQDVRVTVEHALGATAAVVDQSLGGGRWSSIGTYAFAASARVIVHSSGRGTTCADAIKLEPSGAQPALAEVIVDNADPGTSSTGKWLVSGGLHPYGSSSLYSHEAGATYSYVLDVPRDGTYEAFLWWTTYSSRLASVRVDIVSGDGAMQTRFIDQRTGGGAWSSIGTMTVHGHATITVHSGGGGSTCADAARLLESQ